MKVLINGITGRMGQEICKLSGAYSFSIIGGFCHNINSSSKFPLYKNLAQVTEKADVLIDFSIPSFSIDRLKESCFYQIPYVIATTGFSKKQEQEIIQISHSLPIFKSANMCFSIHLLKKILSTITPFLENSDIEIKETHHREKLDSPSGTSFLLADAIKNSLSSPCFYNTKRLINPSRRQKGEIGFSSIRGGSVIGEHCVSFFGEYDILEIKHSTLSRRVFAEGAIKAAEFLIKQKPRTLYDG